VVVDERFKEIFEDGKTTTNKKDKKGVSRRRFNFIRADWQ